MNKSSESLCVVLGQHEDTEVIDGNKASILLLVQALQILQMALYYQCIIGLGMEGVFGRRVNGAW